MYPRMRPGIHDSISLINQKPKRVPATPPRKKRSSDSVRSCPASRPSVAPSAPRTANSLVRLVARASIRFATFAQAIKRISPTITKTIISSGPPSFLRISQVMELTSQVRLAFVCGNCFSRPKKNTPASASACSCVTPGFSRPNAGSQEPPRSARCLSVSARGVHKLAMPINGN